MKKQSHVFLFVFTLLAVVAIAASVVLRVYLEEAEGRKAARDSFSRLCTVLAPVRTASDLAAPGIREGLLRYYRESPNVLLVSVYERGSGVRWRIPARSDYLPERQNSSFIPQPDYPIQSAFLLAAALPADVTGKLAVDGLYVILPQVKVFGILRDAGLALAALIFVLACFLLGQSIADRKKPQPAGAEARRADSGSHGDEVAAEASKEDAMMPLSEESPYSAPTDEDFEVPSLSEEPDSHIRAGAESPAPPDAVRPASASREAAPGGLFSPLSGLGWESYLENRLDAELSRAASFEQDLSLLFIRGAGLAPGQADYGITARAIADFFSFRDLAFERGPDGFAVIMPNMDAEHGLRMAEEFRRKLNQAFTGNRDRQGGPVLAMGLSSRAGRLVDSSRVCQEADIALRKAATDSESHIMAFRPDPDRYRLYLAAKGL
jgi:GGDEF domain-containing protein